MIDRMAQLQKLHAADPADAFCTYGIALEHAKLGQIEQAIHWLDKTLDIDPHYCYAYFQKGKMLSQQGQREAGRLALQTGLTKAQESGDQHAAAEISSLLQTF